VSSRRMKQEFLAISTFWSVRKKQRTPMVSELFRRVGGRRAAHDSPPVHRGPEPAFGRCALSPQPKGWGTARFLIAPIRLLQNPLFRQNFRCMEAETSRRARASAPKGLNFTYFCFVFITSDRFIPSLQSAWGCEPRDVGNVHRQAAEWTPQHHFNLRHWLRVRIRQA
jgi:hypothetical protein